MPNIIIEDVPFNRNVMNEIDKQYIESFPVVYIIRNNGKNVAYIGETVSVKRRMKDHLKNSEKKRLDVVHIVGEEKFNKSATLGLETKLINYFVGDQKYRLLNKAKLSKTKSHNYFQKKMYEEEYFVEIWKKLLDKGIVDNKQSVIENRDVFKLSPFKELSEEQLELKDTILEFCQKAEHKNMAEHGQQILFISGEAGTGKSVLLSATFNELQRLANDKEIDTNPLYGTENYLLVNHSEMLKTYTSIAKNIPNLQAKNFMKPTSFINKMDKEGKRANIVFIDEAHLLLSKKDAYNSFHYENQLEEVIKRADTIICMYDEKQILKMKSYWDSNLLKKIKKNYRTIEQKLTEQFRMKASISTLKWIDSFVNGKIAELPNDNNYEIKIFESLEKMHEAIKEKNNKYGISRVVSTFDYAHKKDGKDYFVGDDKFKLPWNRNYKTKTWAEMEQTIDEVGSIYTIQGFDLNYVGVNIGPSVKLNKNTLELELDTSKYCDTEAYKKNEYIPENEVEQIKQKIILNSLNVLMKRGVYGLYLYADDKELNNYLLELQQNRANKNSENTD